MQMYFTEVSKTLLDIKPNKRLECFNWGIDNAFPSLVEALNGLSVTALECSEKSAKAIYGKSFGINGKNVVNSAGETLNEVFRQAAIWFAKHYNCFLHIGYDGNYDLKSIKCIPTTDARLGKADDREYSGKIIVYNNWDRQKGSRILTKNYKTYDRYNPNKEIVKKQVEKAGGIENYEGQVLHIKKDPTMIYSLPPISPVLSETLLEANSQLFRSRGAEEGFLNTKLLVTNPFKDDKTRENFIANLKKLKGAKGSNGVVLLEPQQAMDDVAKQIHLDDLSGEYNDKLFEYSDKQAEKNICKAYNVPLMLISQTDNSLFGSSGEMLKEAKLQLWENKEAERLQLEEAFSGIVQKFQEKKRITEGLKAINPYIDEDEEQQAKNLNKKSQATLRGSVGGVTAITSLLQNVNQNLIGRVEAVEVVKNIYGFTKKQAQSMIGGFDQDGNVIEK